MKVTLSSAGGAAVVLLELEELLLLLLKLEELLLLLLELEELLLLGVESPARRVARIKIDAS